MSEWTFEEFATFSQKPKSPLPSDATAVGIDSISSGALVLPSAAAALRFGDIGTHFLLAESGQDIVAVVVRIATLSDGDWLDSGHDLRGLRSILPQ
jgi:hypothetical protein